jgi:target of rapamycin complex 2 subunit MAPKAP1
VILTVFDHRYLIHNLRLTYLRHVEDPFGGRIICVNPNYASNAYIVASGLADTEKWPELNISQSSAYEEDEFSGPHSVLTRHSAAGYPATSSLKYTRTIRPNTQNAQVLRNRRNRGRSERGVEHPLPPLPTESSSPTQRSRSDSSPDPVLNGSGSSEQIAPKPENFSEKRRSIGTLSLDKFTIQEVVSTQSAPFKPPFARAAEMERRRKARIRQRARQVKLDSGVPLSPGDIDTSSESDALSPDSDFGDQDEDEA